MEFSLIHAGLAAGAGLAALPVILHLFMRQTPKHLIFPALQLIRERQKRSKKRLRVKNWLLLLARMAVIALMALALARPRLHSDVALGDDSVPTALGLVFDTSLSMQYKEPGKDKTRLDEAKERAREILKQVPESSQVYVIDSYDPAATGLAPTAALKQIESLTTHAANRPLNIAVGQAYRAIADSDRPRREVYVLTDLAKSSWNASEPAEGLDIVRKAAAKPSTKISTYVLRVTSEDLVNVAIVAAEPSSSVATQGESINIKATLRSTGPATKRVVEFYLDGQKKDQKAVDIPASGQTEVDFATPRLKEGEVHKGWIQLSGTPDPLEFDDRRYFAFRVRPAFKILLVSDDLVRDTQFVAAALDIDDASTAVRSIQIQQVVTSQLVSKYRDALKGFSCVFLLNAASPDAEAWGLLNAYVHEGGGLVVGLGHRCVPESYNGPIPAQLLPAQLVSTSPLREETTFGKLTEFTHPLFQLYGNEIAGQLSQVPIYQYWKVKIPETAKAVRTLLRFADGSPALIERDFPGQQSGHTLLWTTPLARRADRKKEPGGWNEFPQASYGYSFLVLMLRTVPYLAGISDEQLNYEAGENVTLTLESGVRYKNFLLSRDGEKTAEQQTPTSSSNRLEILAPQSVGQFSVRAFTQEGQETQLGFAVNPPSRESELSPLDSKDLESLFGKDGYKLAENRVELEKYTRIAHVGYEIFPWLMILIVIIVTAENFLANTFYKEKPSTAGVGATG
jgi:hypothetical protein